MQLPAESAWSNGEMGNGPDKKAEARAELDKYREEEGLPPVEWESESAEDRVQSRQRHARYPRDACPDRPAGDRASSEGNPSDGEAGFTPAKQPYSGQAGPRVRRV
jgi:hypothetical protein